MSDVMKCRKCGHPIKKLDNVYPEFKRVLLADKVITPEEGLGVYDIKCYRQILKEVDDRNRIKEMLSKAGEGGRRR